MVCQTFGISRVVVTSDNSRQTRDYDDDYDEVAY